MASELYPLPQNLLNFVASFTANTTSGSVYLTSVSSVATLAVGQFVFGNKIPSGTTIAYVDSYSNVVKMSKAATGSATGVSVQSRVSSYSTDSIYAAVPNFLQETDGASGYPLYAFIYGIASTVDIEINSLIRDGIGASGYADPQYANAPGWSQLVDIDRCPTFALPWLGQLVGVSMPSGLTRSEMVSRIKNRSGFQRGTSEALVSVILRVINASGPNVPAVTSDIVVLEQTQYSSGEYSHDDYSMVILIPGRYFSSYTYQSLYDAVGNANSTTTPTYSQTDTFIGGPYSNINASLTPSTASAFSSYLIQYRPAGIKVFIGGY